jgi:ribosomal protein S18 acetylase RimI-like enzyme
MVEQVRLLLRPLGCRRLTLYVACDNLKVEGFYRRLGFERNDVVSLGLSLTPP